MKKCSKSMVSSYNSEPPPKGVDDQRGRNRPMDTGELCVCIKSGFRFLYFCRKCRIEADSIVDDLPDGWERTMIENRIKNADFTPSPMKPAPGVEIVVDPENVSKPTTENIATKTVKRPTELLDERSEPDVENFGRLKKPITSNQDPR